MNKYQVFPKDGGEPYLIRADEFVPHSTGLGFWNVHVRKGPRGTPVKERELVEYLAPELVLRVVPA